MCWIAFKDEMPEQDELVIARTKYDTIFFSWCDRDGVEMAYLTDEDGRVTEVNMFKMSPDSFMYDGSKIEYWMSIPELPNSIKKQIENEEINECFNKKLKFVPTEDGRYIHVDHINKFYVYDGIKNYQIIALVGTDRYIIGSFPVKKEAEEILDGLIETING